mgnify:CR=1 FL=1
MTEIRTTMITSTMAATPASELLCDDGLDNDDDDWDGFWRAYSRALGHDQETEPSPIDGWQGGVERGLPLAWHLDRLRESGFYAVDCFARWHNDALYGGIKEGTREQ